MAGTANAAPALWVWTWPPRLAAAAFVGAAEDLAARFRSAVAGRGGPFRGQRVGRALGLWQDEIVGVLLGAGKGAEEVDLQVPEHFGASHRGLGPFQGCPCEVGLGWIYIRQSETVLATSSVLS